MQFEIRQARLSLRRTYTALFNGQIAFEATSTLFRFLARIDVVDLADRTVVSIRRLFSLFRAAYDFDIAAGKSFQFRTQSLWRSVYTLKTNEGVLTVYGHRGRKHSIYRGHRQVAYFEKRLVTLFEGDTYTGLADDDEDPAVIASIVIALDDHLSRDSDGAIVSFDFGSIGPQAKRFNPTWRPTQQSPNNGLHRTAAGRKEG